MNEAKQFYQRYWQGHNLKANAFDHRPAEWTQENFEYHYDFFKPYVKGTLLDFGCGEGQFLNWMKPFCERGYGVDIAPEAITRARENCSGVDFQVMENGQLSFQEELFDAVCAVDVLEHLMDAETALEEIHRVLKPGGHLLIATSELTVLKMIMISLYSLDNYFNPASPHVRHFTRRNLERLLAHKGFQPAAYQKNRTYLGLIPQGQMVVATKVTKKKS
jgi:2-polyprenyl-3-methyl-5-hydroxy-6-metoxy-1,4-benzoquinol methylase